jgi:hypothetical protein
MEEKEGANNGMSSSSMNLAQLAGSCRAAQAGHSSGWDGKSEG